MPDADHRTCQLAIDAHKARADQQEARAAAAEEALAAFARNVEEHDQLAGRAAMSQRNADLAAELRKRVTALERSEARARMSERARIRRGLLGIETVLERPGTGESVVAVETMPLEALIGPDAALIEGQPAPGEPTNG